MLVLGSLCLPAVLHAAESVPRTEESKDPSVEVGPGEAPRQDQGGDQVNSAAKQEAYKKELAAGKAAFEKRDFAEALVHFRGALEQVPSNRYAAFLAGVAAYWNREPRVALEYWEALAEKAQTNSPEEWELTRHLVLAFHALQDDAKAQDGVQRLYALRAQARLPQALASRGFARQNLFFGKRRLDVWEVFDERGELPHVWEYHVYEDGQKGEQELNRLALELEPRADGKPGYALVEMADPKRVYKRWSAKPLYVEAREAAVAAVNGQLQVLDTETDAGPKTTSTKPLPEPETRPTPEADPNTSAPTAEEKARIEKVAAFKLSPVASRILVVAARLAEVDFDVSHYVRLSVSDPAAARVFEAEQLTRRYPQATSDASDLVQYLVAAKPDDCVEVFKHVTEVVTGPKADYARYVLLTALNTRGGVPPVEYLSRCLGSADFVVRGTAALLIARAGHREGLDVLFQEIESSGDAPSGDEVTRIISFYLEELVGSTLGPCPLKNTGPWRKAALTWWKQRGPKLVFVKETAAGQPAWRLLEQP